ncbi:MAG: hypothetical protein ACRENG_09030 [bacterium]
MSQEFTPKPDSVDKPYPETESTTPAHTSRVAEALATYAVRSTSIPRTLVRTIAGLAADDMVWDFVNANNLLPYLEAAIRLARESFQKVSEIKLSFAPDPEIPSFASVAIKVKASGTVDQLVEQNRKYVSSFIQTVPSEHHEQIDLLLVGVV